MTEVAAPALVTRTAEGEPERFPYLSHRTCAEIYGPQLEGLRARSIAQRRKG